MKLIRFFLSNLILITFFCAIIYVYYYWDNLTGEDTPAGQAVAYLSKEFKSVEAFIDGIKIKQSDETPATEAVSSLNDVNTDTAESDTEIVASDTGIVESEPVVVAVKKDVFVTPEIEQSLNKGLADPASIQSSITANVNVSDAAQDHNKVAWIDARKAFYKRDYESSIASYKQLIANSTDNYDAYGEMGNVYFNQGKKAEAAAAYYEAAALLVKLGHQRQADSLLPLLNYLDNEKAKQLQELLNPSQS